MSSSWIKELLCYIAELLPAFCPPLSLHLLVCLAPSWFVNDFASIYILSLLCYILNIFCIDLRWLFFIYICAHRILKTGGWYFSGFESYSVIILLIWYTSLIKIIANQVFILFWQIWCLLEYHMAIVSIFVDIPLWKIEHNLRVTIIIGFIFSPEEPMVSPGPVSFSSDVKFRIRPGSAR